ncbi:sister chromatid cohesion 1 protein 4 [Selaginella moellendorffii]|uniref:sister chromatid cohesion 1 protein 4 n=1 Tax=Selaginella moellendorffii TaxID=88036 RepID=UPI000D1C4DFA|nr:sister chromatid cohesion 1 protein 4 [Selaginella moellendorffii]|eukprot:XP_002985553.2 sister chromatid cohesion 1 protein 4 [Selaginella moellendorffii]
MFYSQFILAKKGPLGTIWIAAHLERKLRKNQVTETNIGVSVDSILCPEVPIALRLSGHLLLGVVRIYSRKVNYLFHDCSEALVKIKQAFHSGAVDLPPEAATAPFHSITLPETFDLDDLELLPDREALFLANSSIDHHVTSREQITLQDTIEDTTYLSSQFGLDERFTDGDAPRLDFGEDVFTVKEKDQEKGVSVEEDPVSVEPMDEDDKAEENIEAANEVPELPNDDAMELDDQLRPSVDANKFDINVVPVEEVPPPPPSAAETNEFAATTESEATTKADGGDEEIVPEVVASDSLVETTETPADARENEDAAPAATAAAAAEEVKEGEEVSPSSLEKKNEGIVLQESEQEESRGDKDITQEQEADKEQDKEETLETQKAVDEDNAQGREITVEKQLEDVPDIEKVRSAPEVPLLEPNVLELPESDSTPAPQKKEDVIDDPVPLVEDTLKLQEVEETPRLSPPSMTRMPEFPSHGDDDLLASILGRRTPSLVVAPTPPAKRHKPGPKPGSRKRKVHFDESMVLDGDHMRQQLADTSSIRRVRKRAPCTDYEVWGSEKDGLGQQMFDEPLIPGSCDIIREVYRSVYSAGDARHSVESDTTEVSARQDKYQLEEEESREPITLEEEPFEDDLFYDLEASYRFGEGLEQPDPFPRTETVASAEKADETTIKENLDSERRDACDKEEAQPSDKPEVVLPEERPCPALADEHTLETPAGADVPEQSEGVVEPAVVNDAKDLNALGDTNELVNGDEKPEEADQTPKLPEARESEATEEGKEEGGLDAVNLEDGQETQADESVGDKAGSEPKQMEDEEAPNDNKMEEEMVVADNTTPAQRIDAIDSDQQVGANNTVEDLDFLVDSKDEDAAAGDDADNYDPDYLQDQAQDNSGWSVRTRAVCQYLRVTFETMESARKERHVVAPKLGLERLLQGKTRRESARMFFESLVLKTKDYINVEQMAPFDNIYISARPKLMKAEM